MRPDAFGEWHEDGVAVEFFLEYDRGTETLARLVDKLGGYERFEAERGASSWVVFAFGSPRREATARRALATVPAATAALGGPLRPADALWLPAAPGRPGRRTQADRSAASRLRRLPPRLALRTIPTRRRGGAYRDTVTPGRRAGPAPIPRHGPARHTRPDDTSSDARCSPVLSKGGAVITLAPRAIGNLNTYCHE